MTVNQKETDAAVGFVEDIEREILAVLERWTRLSDDPPSFSRPVALHALVHLTGCLMLSEVAERGEAARVAMMTLVRDLALHVGVPREKSH